MQLCLTEYTNLKKCPLVTQNQEYSRDSRLNSFQSGGLKEKKLSVSSRFSIAHSSLPHPKETQVHCNKRNLNLRLLGREGFPVTHVHTAWCRSDTLEVSEVSLVQCLVVVTSAVLPAGSDSLNVTNQILG